MMIKDRGVVIGNLIILINIFLLEYIMFLDYFMLQSINNQT